MAVTVLHANHETALDYSNRYTGSRTRRTNSRKQLEKWKKPPEGGF